MIHSFTSYILFVYIYKQSQYTITQSFISVRCSQFHNMLWSFNTAFRWKLYTELVKTTRTIYLVKVQWTCLYKIGSTQLSSMKQCVMYAFINKGILRRHSISRVLLLMIWGCVGWLSSDMCDSKSRGHQLKSWPGTVYSYWGFHRFASQRNVMIIGHHCSPPQHSCYHSSCCTTQLLHLVQHLKLPNNLTPA
jgi:hypothetical protein